jgi:hypothetical protein
MKTAIFVILFFVFYSCEKELPSYDYPGTPYGAPDLTYADSLNGYRVVTYIYNCIGNHFVRVTWYEIEPSLWEKEEYIGECHTAINN